MKIYNRSLLLRGLSATCALALLAACGSLSGRVVEQFDERTAISLTIDDQAIVFARTEARYSRSARDYVYVGPVETNRQGNREYFLWVGIGTTLDRGYLAPSLQTPAAAYLQVNDELMVLPLVPWESIVPGDAREIYPTGVTLKAQLAARITANQLTLIAASDLESIQIALEQNVPARRYTRWDENGPWPGFMAQVIGVQGN